jgi:hypothetical protein
MAPRTTQSITQRGPNCACGTGDQHAIGLGVDHDGRIPSTLYFNRHGDPATSSQGLRVTLPSYQVLIGGDWQGAASGDYFETQNPYTGACWVRIPRCAEPGAHRAVAVAKAAFEGGP